MNMCEEMSLKPSVYSRNQAKNTEHLKITLCQMKTTTDWFYVAHDTP